MATRGMSAHGRTGSESMARETGEPGSHQIEQEAATASVTGPATHNESEITHHDLLDMLAEKRKLLVVQQLIEHQVRPQATAELAVRPSKAFRILHHSVAEPTIWIASSHRSSDSSTALSASCPGSGGVRNWLPRTLEGEHRQGLAED
jgi:hypothetical protein